MIAWQRLQKDLLIVKEQFWLQECENGMSDSAAVLPC